MVIGRGMIARSFARYSNNNQVLIYASGVANSGEKNSAEFERERTLLLKALQENQDRLFIYFSTCSIDDKDAAGTPYVQHKIVMEGLIRDRHHNHVIFRLPQVVGRSVTNRATLVNFLYDKIMGGEQFVIWKHAVRHVIDVEDVSALAGAVIDRMAARNATINIASRPYSVLDIVRVLERITGKAARYELVDKGTPYRIDNSALTGLAKELNITFDNGYLERLLAKYYA